MVSQTSGGPSKGLGQYEKGVEKWLVKTKQRQLVVTGSIALGAAILIFNSFTYQNQPQLYTILNFIGAAVALGPSLSIKYQEYGELKKIESAFPRFLNDIVDSTKSGMTLPIAIKAASKNEYGPLTKHVKKMAAQIDWGVPFDSILNSFAQSVNSRLMKRTVSTIIETHRSGGNIGDVLKAVSESILQIDKIREERKAHVYSQMVTGYTIYFIFLAVIIGLQKFLIPSLIFTQSTGVPGVTGVSLDDLTVSYRSLFQNLIIIQGFFSGVAIGKMSEGTLIAGMKHVVVLVSVGFTAFVLLL